MWEKTDEVKKIIREKMGEEAYEQLREKERKKAMRKMIAGVSNRNEKDIDETEVEKACAEILRRRQILEKEVTEFRNRSNTEKEVKEQKETKNEKSPSMTESRPWWKLGR